MSRDCIVDRCDKPALATSPLCIKHSVLTPQGLRSDLHHARSRQFDVAARLRDGKAVSEREVALAEMEVPSIEAAIRAYFLVLAGELAPHANEPTPAGAAG